MAWRVESRTETGRWFDHSGAEWTADPTTRDLVMTLRVGAQPLTPVGPVYEPTGPNDEVALYLAALSAVSAPAVTGDPPRVPTVPVSASANIVY